MFKIICDLCGKDQAKPFSFDLVMNNNEEIKKITYTIELCHDCLIRNITPFIEELTDEKKKILVSNFEYKKGYRIK